METLIVIILKFMIWALLVLATIALMGLAVMLLWNKLVPDIFGLATLNFSQAVGLFVLARLLFGGFLRKRS
ncbi:MAG: hypothetical protein LBL94_09420 [Prevotellaceae bacterium]|jgi:hypothetical protein|nr:hypothetical protein [Prevotellaceae bacterium]